jgi:glutamate 5-kinase
MRVVIKVGSQAILSAAGELLEERLNDIIRQIIQLREAGHQVILVSSGAVGLGRGTARRIANREYASSVADKQLLASIGQPQLMAHYNRICEAEGYLAAQLLLTKYDFQTKRSYTNILRLLQKSLAQANLLIIINENDSVAVDELMFTDNDELAGIIAAQVGADKLLLLTSIDGVYNKNPAEVDAELIREVKLEDALPDLAGKTSLGRGGMSSKLNTARKMARVGVMTHIANIAEANIIVQLVLDDTLIGTRVIPEHKQAARKKFLAFTQGHAEAQITVNWGLVKVLANSRQSTSILPIGVEKVSGVFKRGDLIEILNPEGNKIGVGVARYNSQKLSEYLGGKNHPELIHYDYLHIDYDAVEDRA